MDRLYSDDIREIHDVMLERYGGVPGENEPGMIDYMAEKPFLEYFGQELFPGLFMKAAVYMHGFATAQYFVDGNKRTAYGCAAVFLELNGYSINVSDDELYDVALKVAKKEVGLLSLADWIKLHARPKKY